MNALSRTLSAIILFVAWAAPGYAQHDVDALFRDANALFRAGIYNTALARYREAAAAGLDTPLLHYNTGVVSYKLGQYEAAEEAFTRAQASPELAAVAAYNLGLTYRRLGRRGEAEAAFRRAASTNRDRGLANLAERAASSLGAPPERTTTARPSGNFRDPASRPSPEPAGAFRLLMSARFGQDDNVYRTPSKPYVDLAAPGQPLVTPVVQSSSFIPVDVVAQYTMPNEARDTVFQFGYRLDADYYNGEFANADRVSQRLEVGADIDVVGENQRRRRLQSAFYMISHYETNFDPDDGLDREINGVNISDRFQYLGAGVEADYTHTLGRWTYGFDLRFEGRQYQETAQFPGYDHNLSFGRARIAYSLGAKTKLNLGVLEYLRVYDDRLARDANGDLLTTNDNLEYDYAGLELGITYKLSRASELGVDFLHLDRRDAFIGYYDSTQDRLRLRFSYRPNGRLRLSIAAHARVYDYPNAFAFNEPTAGQLDLDDVGAELRGEFQITSQLSAWAQILTDDVTSSDPRRAYSQARSMLGVLWRH